ncbi:hypothetical protein TI39_contig4202g00028 [Zymoseptoria brevis]|uniref:Uncharacterized protein n=1 Tax=Zymoseptoria brevis TaxID=1047168 RepID=A0A0F4GDM4_9PEZI|nr:hypothetical protein TI39_contig4202g00028 [Zymoseptoria brevis]
MASINSTASTAITPTTRCPLLETIPPEIRLQIYDLVFASASNVELLATCTVIYDEAPTTPPKAAASPPRKPILKPRGLISITERTGKLEWRKS